MGLYIGGETLGDVGRRRRRPGIGRQRARGWRGRVRTVWSPVPVARAPMARRRGIVVRPPAPVAPPPFRPPVARVSESRKRQIIALIRAL